ncbi:hypothetical protein ASPCAL10321 [Aspergillus calidoustus]|uniref:GPI anchored protein n=1 Tax=Aspergillus calidoustus TaxID=454130 RepID=A0A0U5G624_ASPCI|nr:hypothetical protein ASPCAL10321 [Aspergillus calidoustus]
MHFSKAIVPLALLTLSSARPTDDPLGDLVGGILTAGDGPESSYSVNPTVVQTGASIAASGIPTGVSGPVSASVSESSTSAAATADTTSIPTNILTAPDTDPTNIGSMSTVVETATLHQSQGASTALSGVATPSPTDDPEDAANVLGSPISMLGMLLVPLLAQYF